MKVLNARLISSLQCLILMMLMGASGRRHCFACVVFSFSMLADAVIAGVCDIAVFGCLNDDWLNDSIL